MYRYGRDRYFEYLDDLVQNRERKEQGIILRADSCRFGLSFTHHIQKSDPGVSFQHFRPDRPRRNDQTGRIAMIFKSN